MDQLDPPTDKHLLLFSLRVREKTTASNTLLTLIDAIADALSEKNEARNTFEAHLTQTGYSPLETDRYAELKFRIVNEQLYEMQDRFPRLSESSFADGLPINVERVEYEINLDPTAHLVVTSTPTDFQPPRE